MKIALAQFNPTVGDFEGNWGTHSRAGADGRVQSEREMLRAINES
jgi:hypothetical protein